ncbi:putative enzyme [Rhodospirillaceae bacterium LM-1]|nr:putative enzyme [Rhodospirillaceae bacterium LM-1]
MNHIPLLISRYILPFWPLLVGSVLFSLLYTALNAASLAVFALILQSILVGSGIEQSLSPDIAAVPTTFNLSDWNNYFSFLLRDLRNLFGSTTFLVLIGAAFLLITILGKIAEYASSRLAWQMRGYISQKLTTSLFFHISNLSLDFFMRFRTGDLISRVGRDAYGLATSIYDICSGIFQNVTLALLFWTLLFQTSLKLTLSVIATFVLSTAATLFISRQLKTTIIRSSEAQSDADSRLHEVIAGIPLVKSFGTEEFEYKRFSSAISANMLHTLSYGRLKRFLASTQSFVQSLALIIVLVLGALLSSANEMSAATLLLYFVIMFKAQGPTRLIFDLYTLGQTASAYISRVFEIFEERTSVPEGHKDAPPFTKSVSIENVSFSYDDREQVITNLCLEIKRGEIVALVGTSGSGKSTIINLLLRFFDPLSGRIRLDGIDIREFRQASYRRHFGVVTQDPILFNDSIRANIAYGSNEESCSDADVEKAARMAYIHDFIASLPQGYDTMIGDHGVRLSGGQRQRLTLARAILRNPDFLVLDEATSALDGESEQKVQQALECFLRDRTAIIVAHRLSTIRFADRIVVLTGGKIVEQGSHDELLALNGAYARLFCNQTGGLVSIDVNR